jgi:hypothetical protein
MASKSKQTKIKFQPPTPQAPESSIDTAIKNALWTRNLNSYNRDPEAIKRQREWDAEFKQGR